MQQTENDSGVGMGKGYASFNITPINLLFQHVPSSYIIVFSTSDII